MDTRETAVSVVGSIAEIDAVRDYLTRIGAEVRSTRKAIVREDHGRYWKDICVINFSPEGEISCSKADFEPTEAEAAQIKQAFRDTQWPRSNTIVGRVKVPEEMLVGVEPDEIEERIFEFRNAAGEFVMFQKRVESKKNGKAYLPWTYWDDGKWRQLEPMGPLPLWGVSDVHGHDTVFVHEGAKAARHMKRLMTEKGAKWQELKKRFPWAEEMENAAHVGWIGGALNPDRTDWGQLEALGVKKVYVVADNDQPGKDALKEISRNINLPTYAVVFTDQWNSGFDLADPWPEKMFADIDGVRAYVGPSFHEVITDITWATNATPVPGKVRPLLSVRDVFKSQWTYVRATEVFVSNAFPNLKLSETQFNKHMSAYSHTSELSKLMHQSGSFSTGEMVYMPGEKIRRLISGGGAHAVNTHVPCFIKPLKGSVTPFINFMEYLFPRPEECREMLKWCATLIARPEVKMGYGVLLVSEQQGMGKTTLGSHVLAPLVGMPNVSWPSEIDIVQSQFNDWIAEKRLIIINEIYSGHSWRAYNNLKSYITDKDLRVNVKFQKPYVIENWAHFFACSNSLRALKMDEHDRRWYYPSVAHEKWPKEKFVDFYAWLRAGGLRVIRHWAENHGEYVAPSDPAPMSGAKLDLIFESYTASQKEAAALGKAIAEREAPTAVSTGDVEVWLKGKGGKDEIGSTGHELRKSMKAAGCKMLPARVVIKRRPQYIMVNEAFIRDVLDGNMDNVTAQKVTEHLCNPELILPSEM